MIWGMFRGLGLYYADPAQPLTTARGEIDDLGHDLSDLSVRGVRRPDALPRGCLEDCACSFFSSLRSLNSARQQQAPLRPPLPSTMPLLGPSATTTPSPPLLLLPPHPAISKDYTTTAAAVAAVAAATTTISAGLTRSLARSRAPARPVCLLFARRFVFVCVGQEYFLSEDAGEVLRSVRELKSPAYHYEIVKRGINMSLDARDHEVS